MRQLLLATRNAHKTRELAQLLGDQFEIRDLRAHPDIAETIESGKTFAENATLKALAASRRIPGLVVADDSGLEVDALAGAPGIFSARYAGKGASDRANVEKLLGELSRAPATCSRRARFRCVLALARDGKIIGTCEGVVEGSIAARASGASGFGYDPVFAPDGFEKTFAELPQATKNQISHRARAVAALGEMLGKLRPGCA